MKHKLIVTFDGEEIHELDCNKFVEKHDVQFSQFQAVSTRDGIMYITKMLYN